MRRLLNAVRSGRFLVVGRAGMDLFVDPPGVSVEHGETFHSGLGGSAANIAVGLAKFGAKSALVTCVSDDAVGRFCLNQLDRYGVDRRYVRQVGGEARNQVAIYDSVLVGHTNTIYRNGAADFEMTSADIDAVDMDQFDALITAGTVFAAEPSRTAAFRAFERARASDTPIIFDIDYRPYSWPSPEVAADVLSRAGALADAVVGNDEEFGFMAGGLDKGFEMARRLAAEGTELIIYKRGAEGAVSLADGDEIATGVYPVDAVKPNGAGDSFMAGLLSGIIDGLDLRESVLRGSACAAMVVARPGCAAAMPDHDDLAQFLRDHPGATAPTPL